MAGIPLRQVSAMSDELQGMEKQAIIGTLASAAALHAGVNTAFKGFRSTQTGHNFEAGSMATGFRNGMGGKQLHPVARNVATYGIGPESLVDYDLGQQLGSQMKGMSKGRQYRALKKLRKNVAMTKHIKEAPVGRSIVPAVNRVLNGNTGIADSLMEKVPTVAAGAKPTVGQRIMSAGLAGGAIAADPHTAVHMGINATRDMVGRSKAGQTFMRDQLQKGLQQGDLGTVASHAADIAISPAAFDTRRMGAAMAKEYAEDPRLATRVAKSIGGQVAELPSVQGRIQKALGGLSGQGSRLRGMASSLLRKV